MDYYLGVTGPLTDLTVPSSESERNRVVEPEPLLRELARYREWLQSQPLSPHTIRAYGVRAKHFVSFFNRSKDSNFGDWDRISLLAAAGRFQTYLEADPSISPSTTNALLAAVEHFFQFLRLPEVQLHRKRIITKAPNSLNPDQERRYLETVVKTGSVKESALIHVLLATGIRIAECAELKVTDFESGPYGNWLSINSAQARKIPLDSNTAVVLQDWLRLRNSDSRANVSPALFPNRQGKPISTRGIDYIVRKLGYVARLLVSAEVLRQTCLLKLFKGGHDLNTVAAVTGFKALRNAQRYCQADASKNAIAADGLL
jgi:site-specific recombinase XerD